MAGVGAEAAGVADLAVRHEPNEPVLHARMGEVEVLEQHDGAGPPAQRRNERILVLVAHIAGRRTDEARQGVNLRVVSELDPDERLAAAEDLDGEAAREVRFAHACRPGEEHDSLRPVARRGPQPAGNKIARRLPHRLALAHKVAAEPLLYAGPPLGCGA